MRKRTYRNKFKNKQNNNQKTYISIGHWRNCKRIGHNSIIKDVECYRTQNSLNNKFGE